MTFLTAQWKNLIMANYIVNPNHLEKYVPKGTELDYWKGNCYVSLVGFLFKDTKILGFKIPKHTDFEEVNLRFYVKRLENGTWKRGVVFIKEIVPKAAITFVANTIYKENYETLAMYHKNELKSEIRTVSYHWKNQRKTHSIEVNAYDFSTPIEADSEEEFITEHYFGYTKYNKNTTYEYEVKHPKWNQYAIKDHKIDIDFKETYGTGFSFLGNLVPASVFLTDGSEIQVENKRKITL
ncbi:YqjF family protein [Flavobacterium sp.]|uniref:YqjF family protein n=1 Tax=Flavobacterium sp. TaxID=239 RepID=UPI003D6C64DE